MADTEQLLPDDALEEELVLNPNPAHTWQMGGWRLGRLGAAVAVLMACALLATKAKVGRKPLHSLLRRPVTLAAEEAPCLCAFDVDRTLSGKQGWASQCADDQELHGIQDQAYGQGDAMESQLAQHINSTFCKKCFRGIVTAGIVSGDNSAWRKTVLELLGGTSHTRTDWWQHINWNAATKVKSSLVVAAVDGKKQDSLRGMVEWWRDVQNVPLEDKNVYFFDDVQANVEAFQGTGYNAQQVSCESRGVEENMGSYHVDAGHIGGCGGTTADVDKVELQSSQVKTCQ